MKIRVSLLTLVALAVIAFAIASEPAPGTAADLVGSWSLAPVEKGETAAGPGTITLVLALDQGKLGGVAILPLQNGEKRWPVVYAAFDGRTFSFQVDNGEGLLTGEMQLVDGRFEGRWHADANPEEAGRLTMTRKAD